MALFGHTITMINYVQTINMIQYNIVTVRSNPNLKGNEKGWTAELLVELLFEDKRLDSGRAEMDVLGIKGNDEPLLSLLKVSLQDHIGGLQVEYSGEWVDIFWRYTSDKMHQLPTDSVSSLNHVSCPMINIEA
ncbi:hypothetical protein SADUNF_Sadunf10G0058800 [Salix dunnii]|uniref:Uncharacterized protein n=1 Tax=Salix dunnii TaxID=1413687 RepID=A0A835JSH7_9ROSI|nr:hypothetical protein SADUNF_Sadunf10G0058800 [Salix dunnii]